MASNSVRQSGSVIGDIFRTTARILGGTLLGIVMVGGSAIAGSLVGLAFSFRDLPDVRVLRGYVPTETTYIYDINGELLARLHGDVNREVVPLNRISPHLKRSVLAIEDSYFYTHKGVDPAGIGRAILVNFKSGETMEGGSTLTQQLVKNLFLSSEKSLNRKVAEAVLAMRVEQVFSKDQILEMYLNQVYWGRNANGVEAASQNYFDKHAADLNLAESAMMAGVIQAPSAFNPRDNYKTAKERQSLVLERMLVLGWATPAEVKAAKDQPIRLTPVEKSYERSKVPYVTQAVAAELEDKFGRELVLKGGLRVQTTIDLKLQRTAEKVAKQAHADLEYQGANAGQIALVAVDPRTGFVKAIVGGVGSFEKNQFNRAVQARRQLGSSFKPFVYYSAFATGDWHPDSVVDDSPISFPDGDEMYVPRNYDNTFMGPISVRQAIAVSRNIPAIRLGLYVGMKKVVENCRKLGITTPMEPVVSLPLGAADVTPMEVAGAYATFANGGYKVKTTLIARVTNSNGNVVLDNTPKPTLILDPYAVAELTDALRGVITNGTGTAASLGSRPVAGKTGTTSDFRDAWFVGYVPQLATAIWIGNDDYSPMSHGVTGGVYVAPIWRNFMEKALDGSPVENFPVPSEINAASKKN